MTLVPPHPDAPSPPPPSAYLYLAQLSDDDPQVALQHYQSAVNVLTIQLKGKERATAEPDSWDADERNLKNSIVRALIGMVEIWMDPSYDLWCVVLDIRVLRRVNSRCSLVSIQQQSETARTC